MSRPAVLFVCLGNICRSPLAEAAFRAAADRDGLEITVDSAGTGRWHIGKPPDRRAQAVAKSHGIDISSYRARRVAPSDFDRFDYIVAMDRANLDDLRAMCPPDWPGNLSMLLDHVAGQQGLDVRAPIMAGQRVLRRRGAIPPPVRCRWSQSCCVIDRVQFKAE